MYVCKLEPMDMVIDRESPLLHHFCSVGHTADQKAAGGLQLADTTTAMLESVCFWFV